MCLGEIVLWEQRPQIYIKTFQQVIKCTKRLNTQIRLQWQGGENVTHFYKQKWLSVHQSQSALLKSR